MVVNLDENSVTLSEPLPELPQPETKNFGEELKKLVYPHLVDMDYLDSRRNGEIFFLVTSPFFDVIFLKLLDLN